MRVTDPYISRDQFTLRHAYGFNVYFIVLLSCL